MKKIQMIAHNFIVTSTLIAAGLLAQACGSSSNNVSAVTAEPATTLPGTYSCTGACATTPGQVYSSCTAYGGQMTTVTSGGTNVSVCRYTAAQSVYFDIQAMEMNISGGAASGGTITGIQLDQGDKLEVVSTGHYSPSGGVCDSNNGGGDISVLGNSNKTQDPTINPTNGLNDGLWYAFENTSGQYSSPVNATSQLNNGTSYQTIQVPLGSVTSSLVLGYNSNGSIACGDMGAYYTIIRCADASGNTYTCN
jgi:hypothetical protein